MAEAVTTTDPVKLARAVAEKRVALVTAAARRQNKIQAMLGKISDEQTAYESEYRVAMDAWSKTDLDAFGLLAPDQVVKAPPALKKPVKATTSGARKT